MADYTKSKGLPKDSDGFTGQVYPENMTQTAYGAFEPLITPDQLRWRLLFGVPLISRYPDPMTGKPAVMTNEILGDFINRAIAEAELLLKCDIMPKKYAEKQPYDRVEFNNYGYMRLNHKPIWSLDRFSVCGPDDQDILIVPNEWLDLGYLAHGEVHILPLSFFSNSSDSTSVPNVSNPSGNLFLSILSGTYWVSSFFKVEYSTGFPNGCIPVVVNELLGVIASINILSALAATFLYNSSSLGIDGMSQSASGPGNQIYLTRIGELKEQRDKILGRLQTLFAQKIIVGNV